MAGLGPVCMGDDTLDFDHYRRQQCNTRLVISLRSTDSSQFFWIVAILWSYWGGNWLRSCAVPLRTFATFFLTNAVQDPLRTFWVLLFGQ
jgi:hypothetical protein